jgi:O-antigen/teichoic acid export membrane protein
VASSSARIIAKSTAVLIISHIAGALLTLLTYRIVLSTLTKDEFGSLFWVQQTGMLVLTVLVEAGMTTMTMGMVVRSPERADVIIATLFRLRVLMFTLALCCLIVLSLWCDAALTPLFVLWSVHVWLSGKTSLFRGIIEMRTRAASNQVPAALASIIDSVILLVLVWFDREHLTTLSMMVWCALCVLPSTVWLMLRAREWKTLKAPFDASVAREIIRVSLPVFVVVVLQQIHDKADTLFLDAFATKAEVGIYGAAYRLAMQAFVVVVLIAHAMFPVVTALAAGSEQHANQEQSEHSEHTTHQTEGYHSGRLTSTATAKASVYLLFGTRIIMVCALGFAMLASATMPWLIQLTAGALYMDATNDFVLFVWAVAFGFVQVFLLTMNGAIGWQSRNYGIFGILVAVTLTGNFALTPLLSVKGALITKAVAFGLSSLAALKVLSEYCGSNAVRKLTVQFCIALAGGGASVIVLLEPQWLCSVLTHPLGWVFPSGGMHVQNILDGIAGAFRATVVRFVLTMAIFAALLAVSGIIGRREIETIRSLLQARR